MKYPKQLKPIISFIFSCNRKSGNNKFRASIETQRSHWGGQNCEFPAGSSLACALHPHGHKMDLLTLGTGSPCQVRSRGKSKKTCGEKWPFSRVFSEPTQ